MIKTACRKLVGHISRTPELRSSLATLKMSLCRIVGSYRKRVAVRALTKIMLKVNIKALSI